MEWDNNAILLTFEGKCKVCGKISLYQNKYYYEKSKCCFECGNKRREISIKKSAENQKIKRIKQKEEEKKRKEHNLKIKQVCMWCKKDFYHTEQSNYCCKDCYLSNIAKLRGMTLEEYKEHEENIKNIKKKKMVYPLFLSYKNPIEEAL